MSAHTPGPWTVDLDTVAHFPNDARSETLWEIVNRDEGATPGYATNEPDARLIASAPELLAALQWVTACLARPGLHMDPQAAIDKARAAIRKATGESA